MFALTNEHLAAIRKPGENRKFRLENQILQFYVYAQDFHPAILSRWQAPQASFIYYLYLDLQSLTVDVFVCLARYSIRANELWNFLSLFNSPDPPVVRN